MDVEVRDVVLPLTSRWTALVSSITMHAEAAAVHERLLRTHAASYGGDVLPRLLAGRGLSTADYARAQATRGAIRAEVLEALRRAGGSASDALGSAAGVDVLIAPATPAPAAVLQAGALVPGDAPWSTEPGAFHLQRLPSLLGLPTVSVPSGRHSSGLPMGIQVMGRPWDEALLLGVAAAVAETVPPDQRLPAVAPL
jgi:aspartyl-tRNA(Asn)/glutamyl-tRNA(Gln) amidotransferase subunit A